jgi:hypothetical protein
VGMTELGGQRGRCETDWRCDHASPASLKLLYECTAVLLLVLRQLEPYGLGFMRQPEMVRGEVGERGWCI